MSLMIVAVNYNHTEPVSFFTYHIGCGWGWFGRWFYNNNNNTFISIPP